MDIEAIFVHRVTKDRQHKAKTHIHGTGNTLNTKDPLVKLLIERIKELYKVGKTFGSFDSDVKNYPFQTDLTKYLNEPQKYTIQKLSDSVMDKLIIEMNKEPLSTGGYMVFFHFKDAGKQWFFVVMLKDKKGFLFNDKLELKDVDELDLNKLHQAVRVDIDVWKTLPNTAYLSFIKSGSGDIASYFLNTFGCTDSISSKVSTSAVFNVIKEIACEHNLDVRKTKLIEDSVASFLMGYKGKGEVSLERLANHVDLQFEDDLKGIFIEKANSEDYLVSDTFLPDQRTLNRYKKIVSKSNYWNISIDRLVIGEKGNDKDSGKEVLYDKKNKAIIIKNLPQTTIVELDDLFTKTSEED